MKYSRLDIQAVEEAADIREFFHDIKGNGASRYCKCPECGAAGKNKGLQVWRKKKGAGYVSGAKCYNCGFSLSGAINAFMHVRGVDFLTAVDQLAMEYNVNLSPVVKPASGAATGAVRKSFCEMQLFASGLTFDDVVVRVPVKGSDDFTLESPFRKGGAEQGRPPSERLG